MGIDGLMMLGNTPNYGYDCGKEIHDRPGALDDWGTLCERSILC